MARQVLGPVPKERLARTEAWAETAAVRLESEGSMPVGVGIPAAAVAVLAAVLRLCDLGKAVGC